MASKTSGMITLALSLLGSNLATSGFDRIGPKPVVIGGVAYIPHAETRPEGVRAIFVRSVVLAVDVRTDRELWSIPLGGPSKLAESAIDDSIRSMARFADGVLVRTFAGYYYVDPAARTSRPVADHRIGLEECEVHHRPFGEDVVQIHYGLSTVGPGRLRDGDKPCPHAFMIINAGCLASEANLAAVRYGPGCREAIRASVTRTGDNPK